MAFLDASGKNKQTNRCNRFTNFSLKFNKDRSSLIRYIKGDFVSIFSFLSCNVGIWSTKVYSAAYGTFPAPSVFPKLFPLVDQIPKIPSSQRNKGFCCPQERWTRVQSDRGRTQVRSRSFSAPNPPIHHTRCSELSRGSSCSSHAGPQLCSGPSCGSVPATWTALVPDRHMACVLTFWESCSSVSY